MSVKWYLLSRWTRSLRAFYWQFALFDNGERFDPVLISSIDGQVDCHELRYKFAKKLVFSEDTVLDICCGTGYGSQILAEKAKKVIGVDGSIKAIKFAEKRYKNKRAEFIRTDFWDYKKKADVVVAFETVEHIKAKSLGMVVGRLRWLAKRLLVANMTYNEAVGNSPFHYFFQITEKDLKKMNLGKIKFYFQAPDGRIVDDKCKIAKVQNLIFVIRI